MSTKSLMILSNAIHDNEYAGKVLPFLKEEYFESESEQVILQGIKYYTEKYHDLPSPEGLAVVIDSEFTLNERVDKEVKDSLGNMKNIAIQNHDWMMDMTETFCRDRAIYLAILKSVDIYEKRENFDVGAIPDLLKDAISVSFNTTLGHDYFLDSERRYEYYHRTDIKVKFDLDDFNTITRGGFSKKTINIYLAMTHAGKSALMCHQAAANLRMGVNVLYISLEMSKEEISKRIDANLLDIVLDDIDKIPKEPYLNKIGSLQKKTAGRLIVQDYPMSSAHAGHFRALLNELKLKQKFIPDIIYIDYLNICASSKVKMGNNVNSYTMMKNVSEELRALAFEFDVPVVTASQFNRGANGSSDPDMGDISESFGVNFGADFICALVVDDDLKSRGQLLIKQLKNRYSDMNFKNKFFIGFDRPKMKFYTVEENESSPKQSQPVKPGEAKPFGKSKDFAFNKF